METKKKRKGGNGAPIKEGVNHPSPSGEAEGCPDHVIRYS